MREKSPARRLAWALVAAVVAVGTAISMGGAAGQRPGGLGERYAFAQDALGGLGVDKNAISRAGDLGDLTRDPTTAAEKAAATAYVDRERALPDPELTTAPVTGPRHLHPQDRYALAGGCYTLTADGDPFYFKATDLGSYLIYDADRAFLLADGSRADQPGADAVWDISRAGAGRYSFRNGTGALTLEGATSFRPTRAAGCTPYPESQIDISGRPHAGVTPFQEVRGYVDGHTHGMAFEFLGGDVHCGKPWDRYGAPYALVDCPDHTATGGYGGVLESVLSGEPHHDPVGWPTFKDWPAPNSLTHEGTYYRWLERSWRGGQRIFVNLLVENNQLCQIYPIKRNSCDDMESVRLQAKDMYAMQDYIDAQFGGPGKGFYRIVKSPYQARRVINAGKMAVVMGIETSVPFGCTFKAQPGGDVPACDVDDIDAQLDQVKRMGVRQMELVNKFDNALSGIAGDNGEVGVAVNSANFLETGTFWDMEHCEPEIPGAHDHNQLAAPDISAGQQDALFGAIGELFGPLNLPALPVYPPPDHCNSRGLTTLGEYTIKGLAQRHMIFDPDHMSVKARTQALDQIDDLGYHGVISSHSWATPDAYPRIYEEGGFITPYAGDSTGFVEKWRTHLGWADPRYYWGIGYGADMNGLGAQGDPRGADVPNPVGYPFTGLGGVQVDRQHAGERVYDINVDGVAQYGLYPDWIQDLGQVADAQHQGDGARIKDDMARGAEAYLQMWERAEGIAPDSCRNPGLRKPLGRALALVRPGMTTKQVMQAVGQPYTRLGTTYGFCAKTSSDPKVLVTVTFSRAGRVAEVTNR
ncbi:hypothetical protein [Nocardioides sp.]|uniref:hypothetical protein n=1 Tax=Nocardioides sp. TaxID=35761 RepID=UPI002628FBD7|nr:hypothetical protein [Nocardioides sp.]MDI6908732.1 hypothetical protein [Nocardioides sp.]